MKKIPLSIMADIFAIMTFSFLIACGDDNSVASTDQNEGYRNEVYSSSVDKSRYSSSSEKQSSSSIKRSSSSAVRSSSSSEELEYLTKSKTMKFTLKSYKQTVCSMEGKSKKSCSYDDGDPNVSFTIEFVQPGGSKTTFSTRESINKKWFEYDDMGEWNGELSFTTTVPALTSTIRVCPRVADIDVAFDDDVSSGYCYSQSKVGQLPNKKVVQQSDDMAEKYNLKWEWYLY